MTPPRGLLIDIDGVLVVSWKPIDGGPAALRALRAAGVPMRFLTNTTSKTRADMTASLRTAGFEVDEEEVLTAASGMAAYLHSAHPGGRCLLLNSGDISADLPEVDLVLPGSGTSPSGRADVDVVVVGGAGPELTYEAMDEAFRALMGGAALVAAHTNAMWKTAEGLHLDAGAYVRGLELATGVTPVVIGKPNAAVFEAGATAMGFAPSDTAMVGDDLDSDVRGAQAAGLVGVQVCTGKFRPEQLARIGMQPDVVLDSFADVPGWLGVA